MVDMASRNISMVIIEIEYLRFFSLRQYIHMQYFIYINPSTVRLSRFFADDVRLSSLYLFKGEFLT